MLFRSVSQSRYNTPYIVGEQGPELFIPNSSGQIISNNKLGRLSSNDGSSMSSGGDTHLHLHPEGLIVTNRKQARDASLLLMEEFNKAAKANGWTQVADGKPVAP